MAWTLGFCRPLLTPRVLPSPPSLPPGETINKLDGSFVKLAQLLQFRNKKQERVKEAGAGNARPNSKKPPAFFVGAAASMSETIPSPFAMAFFAFFGAGENRLQKGLAPFSIFVDGLS